jgi:Leucine-rich repeat (LRR) protein
MPLEDLNCDFIPQRDREILRSIKTLVLINGKPAKEVLGQSIAAVDEAWVEQVAALPAAEQVQAVAAKLKELNPGFDGTVNSRIIENAVTELRFCTDNVTDISPVRALTKLRLLSCRGSAGGRGRLSDLSPLKGMKLTCLNCGCNSVADLSPLEGMPLEELILWNTRVARLEALQKNTTLIWLECNGTGVSDLSPLQGMPLKILSCRGTSVTDLSPLKGMPLNVLDCGATQVSDFAPLRGSKLMTRLSGDFKLERDAEILRSIRTLQRINDKPAREFWKEAYPPADDGWVQKAAALPAEEQVQAVAGKLKDLNPGFDGVVHPTIEDGNVVEVRFATDNVMDISALQPLTALKRLICRGSGIANGALWDLAPLKGMKLAQLDCSYNQVSDLSPLEGMPLEKLALCGNPVAKLEPLQKDTTLNSLDCRSTRVSDLSPLQGMHLQSLSCRNTPVTDLSPLNGMPLLSLDCGGTQVSDFSPLRRMKLTAVSGNFKPERDGEILRSIETLGQINGKPAKDFWKEADEKKP